MEFEGFHVKWGVNTWSCGGVVWKGDMLHLVTSPYGGDDKNIEMKKVSGILMRIAGKWGSVETEQVMSADTKGLEDAVVAFVKNTPLAFLQALYMHLNRGHSFRMHSLPSQLATELKRIRARP